jgi:hypothetical protein
MNERIRELATEVGISVEYLTNTKQIVLIEKFAERVIEECIDIAYEYDAPKMSGPGMIIAGRIETHFGVEE